MLFRSSSVVYHAIVHRTDRYLAALLGMPWYKGFGQHIVMYAVVQRAPTCNVLLLVRHVYQHQRLKVVRRCYLDIVIYGTDELVKTMLKEEWLDPSFEENVMLRAAQKMKRASKVALLERDVRVQVKTLLLLTV